MKQRNYRLALVGSGEYLPDMDLVDSYMLSLCAQPPRVVCLPTAAGMEGDAMIDSWSQRGVEHFTRLDADVTSVRVWDRASADDAGFADQIASADLIYLSGGKPAYLYETLYGSLSWQAIQSVLERGGLLAGCSAGAMVQGMAFAGFPWRHGGFGLWPGIQVIPHFDEIPSAVVKAMRLAVGMDTTVVGVDGFTALIDEIETYRVVGRGGVTIWTQTEKVRYTQGTLPPMALAKNGQAVGGDV